jgi:hypothetical protein
MDWQRVIALANPLQSRKLRHNIFFHLTQFFQLATGIAEDCIFLPPPGFRNTATNGVILGFKGKACRGKDGELYYAAFGRHNGRL